MSDTMKEYIAEAETDLLHTYNRYQIVLDKGDGVYLYDTDHPPYPERSGTGYRYAANLFPPLQYILSWCHSFFYSSSSDTIAVPIP